MPEREAEALAAAFRASGWIGTLEPCDTNYILELNGRSFDAYWAARPGALRETVRRKGGKGIVSLRIETTFSEADWNAYEAIYARSWKPEEGNPAFLCAFAMAEAAAGALRMGVAEIDGEPVAAQFWTVEGGTAWIHKLAHDEASRKHSPGTLLSAALLVGCGSSSDATTAADTTAATSTATSTGEKVGGIATCDAASITKAAQGTETTPVALAQPDSFKCADGWAYAFVNVGEGESQYTPTQVFQAEGQFWIPKDRAKVCTAPGNEVPASIYQDACETN